MDSLLPLIVAVIVVVGMLVVLGRGRAVRDQAVQREYTVYQQALGRLRAEPHRQELRQQALDAGRKYASVARQSGVVTAYDEVSILNDINAAAGPAAAIAAPAAQAIEERLQTLEGLRTRGVITEDEYAARRQALINEL